MVRSFLSRHHAPKATPARDGRPKAAISVGFLYVGLGDQFDDDRRLVHDGEAATYSAVHSLVMRRRGRTDPREPSGPGLWHRTTNTCGQ